MLYGAMSQPIPDRIPGERRAGVDRRVAVLPFPLERRQQADRRTGADRRALGLATRDHVQLALDHLVRAAEDTALDDETLRRIDQVLLRLWALLEEQGTGSEHVSLV
jgi:hypothetical protein